MHEGSASDREIARRDQLLDSYVARFPGEEPPVYLLMPQLVEAFQEALDAFGRTTGGDAPDPGVRRAEGTDSSGGSRGSEGADDLRAVEPRCGNVRVLAQLHRPRSRSRCRHPAHRFSRPDRHARGLPRPD